MIIYFLLYLFALSFFENADQLVFITFYTNMNLEKFREDSQKSYSWAKKSLLGFSGTDKRACSPMVEHIVCNDETRVRFSAGPFTIIFNTQKFYFCIESPTGDKTRLRKQYSQMKFEMKNSRVEWRT